KLMNIALIGYGRMGHEIEEMALKLGHQVVIKIDIGNQDDFTAEKLANADVVIEFTSPEAAFRNIVKCFEMTKPVVSGTTGWLKHYDEAVKICRKHGTSFIHSSNFSVGVNIFFRINSELARMMAGLRDYVPYIEEIHHIKKLDAPSGTAITLADGIKAQHPVYEGWCWADNPRDNAIPIKSVREGSVPGTHIVHWDSEIDTLSIKHEAKGRKGFAFGAIIAAEYIKSRKGIFTMNDVLGF
ncbi:MAG: 4-hydroxy-tetrahydrodipicolinate reductase, partial [Bacteroidales bacterium]